MARREQREEIRLLAHWCLPLVEVQERQELLQLRQLLVAAVVVLSVLAKTVPLTRTRTEVCLEQPLASQSLTLVSVEEVPILPPLIKHQVHGVDQPPDREMQQVVPVVMGLSVIGAPQEVGLAAV
jgi:hypothetical protein